MVWEIHDFGGAVKQKQEENYLSFFTDEKSGIGPLKAPDWTMAASETRIQTDVHIPQLHIKISDKPLPKMQR